ncbi:MAG TPA: DNA repair protein RadA [Methylococcaceae bacterium]|jgi:DNA repair protein RadA/Sms|nr:DNA repair protein RadA [Methylococcaceae bacterium]HIN68457.1 DNA repair protein RadA [Methylococcales bacterium]HIA45573.1 DNA repair protein RadA [Methylococcaceae bacterium]HIB63448.1 DNA repair protein RadA [Methylococcaceae bacterium]HIO12311.1 DNA repair protein RadA [Methylococcales bacterium]
MAKQKVIFQCTACGFRCSKWAGQCAGCEQWNTLVEVIDEALPTASRFVGFAGSAGQQGVVSLAEVSGDEVSRFSSGLNELDRVLGGGIVPGSAVLIGGDPGIGKSTLLLQAMVALSQQLKTLYITGEESIQQLSLRSKRLCLNSDPLWVLSETALTRIFSIVQEIQPKVIVIDSIQTVYTDQLQSAPGAVGQVRECAAQLVRFAKQTQTTIFLVGHVTKDGALAGPRVLEHMVDSVLYFEGDSGSRHRIIRAIKNRFGAVNELGVFVMTETGLQEVKNPSAIFLSRHESEVSGSVVTVTREGSRPMLVEVQALVDESHAGNPRRVALGMEQNRLAMLLAVLHRHGGVSMVNQDVFVNVVGGVRITETAGDLAVLMAILSSFRAKPISKTWVAFGEIGLAGEIRPVQNGEERLREASKQGFNKAIIPRANAPKVLDSTIDVVLVSTLSEALAVLSDD